MQAEVGPKTGSQGTGLKEHPVPKVLKSDFLLMILLAEGPQGPPQQPLSPPPRPRPAT